MDTKNTILKKEFSEMLEFVCQLQEAALEQSELFLTEKKELEYKKRQQEFVLEDREKKKVPNISMFSPLVLDTLDEDDVSYKDEIDELSKKLLIVEQQWEKQRTICQSFEKLKRFLYDMEAFFETTKVIDKSDFLDNSTRLLETQEMDRNRISRDLHDSTVQSLTSLGHKMEYCSRMIDRDPVKVKLELQSMIDLNKEIINDMRAIIYDLRPMSLDNIGLVSTVESYCLHLRHNDNMDVLFRVEGEEKKLSSIVSVTLYRIIQEACNNAIRHSKAKRVKVQLTFLKSTIELIIEDNGVGFDIEKVNSRTKEDFLHGFGLSTMQERTKLLSGTFLIDTKPGAGTKIKIVVPVI